MKTLRFAFLGVLALVALGARAQQDIAGTWAGKLALAPGQELAVHFVLTRAQDGGYTAMLTSPDSGAIKNVRVDTVTFAGDKLAMTVSALSGSYEGTLANGAFTGKWQQEGSELPLELKPYTAPVLTQADKARLLGSWVGKLDAGAAVLTIVVRFQNNPAGEFVAFMDSPDQGANNLSATNVSLTDGTLEFRVPRIQGEYSGKLAGDQITGTWSQVGRDFVLNLAKGTYTPTLPNLNLSQAAMTTLAGKWQGKLTPPNGGEVTMVISFESPAAGQSTASVQIVDRGPALPATEATFADGKVTLRVAAVGAQIVGTISGTTMTATLTQGGMDVALTLTKQ